MKRNGSLVFLVTLAICLASSMVLAQEELPSIDQSISRTDVLDISEATFRHMFQKNGLKAKKTTQSYFLTLFGKDPSTSFMMRFSKHKPPVSRGSEFEIGKGLKFNVGRIMRVSSNKVEVSGGYYRGNLSAAGNTYTLEFKEGKWVVTGWKPNWIS